MLLAPLLAVFASPVHALTLSETDRSTLAPGVELVTYRTESPTTDTHVLEVGNRKLRHTHAVSQHTLNILFLTHVRSHVEP